MVLVPIGESVVDITVDGVSLVAGDVINDDTAYNLNTSYDARIDVNGSQQYYNGAHNQNTTYNVSVSSSTQESTITQRIKGAYPEGSSNHTIWSETVFSSGRIRIKGLSEVSSMKLDKNGVTIVDTGSDPKFVNSGTWSDWYSYNENDDLRLYTTEGMASSYSVSLDIERDIITGASMSVNGVTES